MGRVEYRTEVPIIICLDGYGFDWDSNWEKTRDITLAVTAIWLDNKCNPILNYKEVFISMLSDTTSLKLFSGCIFLYQTANLSVEMNE